MVFQVPEERTGARPLPEWVFYWVEQWKKISQFGKQMSGQLPGWEEYLSGAQDKRVHKDARVLRFFFS